MLAVLQLPITLPVLPISAVHGTPIVALNYDAGETIGWPAFTAEIATVYRTLPPAQRSATTVLTSNYGESGAVDQFGPADGLPAAYSGHMSFWALIAVRFAAGSTIAAESWSANARPARPGPGWNAGRPRGAGDHNERLSIRTGMRTAARAGSSGCEASRS